MRQRMHRLLLVKPCSVEDEDVFRTLSHLECLLLRLHRVVVSQRLLMLRTNVCDSRFIAFLDDKSRE